MKSKTVNSHSKAPFYLRLTSTLIDLLVLLIPNLLFVLYIAGANNITEFLNLSFWYFGVFLVWFLVVYIFYIALFTSRYGGTLGKLVTGLRVVDEEFNYLTDKRSVFRHTIGYFVSLMFLGFGYLWMLKDRKSQAFHDKVSHTYVYLVGSNNFVYGFVTLLVLLLLNTVLIMRIGTTIDKNETLKRDLELFRYEVNQNSYPGPFLR